MKDGDHPASPLYRSLVDEISVCDYCAGAFDVGEDVDESDAERLAEYDGHPSVRDLVVEGYEVVTY